MNTPPKNFTERNASLSKSCWFWNVI